MPNETRIESPATPEQKAEALAYINNLRQSFLDAIEKGHTVTIRQENHAVPVPSGVGPIGDYRHVGTTFSFTIRGAGM